MKDIEKILKILRAKRNAQNILFLSAKKRKDKERQNEMLYKMITIDEIIRTIHKIK